MNGPHQVVATAYGALGNIVATSTAVNFTVANSWPASCIPAMTIATGTALTANWSGRVNLSPTITGGCADDNMEYHFFIDGVQQFQISSTSNTATFPLDTSLFTNGPHAVAVHIKDKTHFASYDSGTTQDNDALEWSRIVTFSNGSARWSFDSMRGKSSWLLATLSL